MKNKIVTQRNIILIFSIIIYCFLVFLGRNQYIYDMSYLKCILFMIFNCLYIYTYGMLMNKDEFYNTNINIYILLFFILLFSITFFIGRTEFTFYNWFYSGQYKLFNTIISQIKYGSSISLLKNLLGNIIMLIPLSLLLMIKDKKYYKISKLTIVVIPIIIFIEVLQTFTHTGSFDIDDILLNYIGIIIFTFLITKSNLINKIRILFYTDYKLKTNIKYKLFYISLIILITFYIFLLKK